MTKTKAHFTNQPKHLAVVMDGNGRWASDRGIERIFGHEKGADNALEMIKWCHEKNIGVLTLFALSTENMTRPTGEVSFIIELLKNTLISYKDDLIEGNVYLNMLGDWMGFGDDLVSQVLEIQGAVKNRKMVLNLAFNYGGKQHLAQSIYQNKKALVEQQSAAALEQWIDQNIMKQTFGHPDLLIRTGGQMRLSNFMLWSLSYTELYFTDVLWPDFGENDLDKALFWYSKRLRKFGQIEETIND